jgi:anti-sigma B factor antagonist
VDENVTIQTAQDEPCIVVIRGEMDVFTSPEVKEALAQQVLDGHRQFVIDLSRVSYIDSTGLGALIAGLKGARENDGSIAIVTSNAQISRIFEITGLTKIFSMFDSVDRASQELRERIQGATP